MRDYPIFVSYYTLGTKYAVLADRMRNALERMGLPYDIVGIQPSGVWSQDASHKPTVLLDAMIRHQRSVIWIDIDAIPRVIPTEWCDDRYDFVTYRSTHPWWFMGNFMRFGRTPNALWLLDCWKRNTGRFRNHTDELILMHAWHSLLCVRSDGVGDPFQYYIGDRAKVAGIHQDNVSMGKRDRGLLSQLHLVDAFKRDVEKRRVTRIWSLDEIVNAPYSGPTLTA